MKGIRVLAAAVLLAFVIPAIGQIVHRQGAGNGGGGAITSPLGSSTSDAAAVATTAAGTVGTGGANLGTGTQGWFATLVSWLSSLNTAISAQSCTQPCPTALHSNNVPFNYFGSPGGAVFSGTGTLIVAQAINLSDAKCVNAATGAEHYLVFYNSATVGAVTVGTTAPAVTLFCPPGNGATKGYNSELYNGAKFNAGMVVFALDNPGTGAGSGVTLAGGGDYTLGN